MNETRTHNEANEICNEDLEAAAEIYTNRVMEKKDYSKIRALTSNMLKEKILIAESHGWTRSGSQYKDYFPGEQAKGKILIVQEMKKEEQTKEESTK